MERAYAALVILDGVVSVAAASALIFRIREPSY